MKHIPYLPSLNSYENKLKLIILFEMHVVLVREASLSVEFHEFKRKYVESKFFSCFFFWRGVPTFFCGLKLSHKTPKLTKRTSDPENGKTPLIMHT